MKPRAVANYKCTEGGAAEAVSLVENRIEHRGEIAGRGMEDLQDLGGRGLLFQSLARLGNEAGVLDRDHRLVGEGSDQFDLSLGKWLDSVARHGDDADHLAL